MTVPSSCSVGDIFVKVNGTPAQQVYICTAIDAYTQQGVAGGGGGSGTVTSVATTGPITGGTITDAGTIACAALGFGNRHRRQA